MSRTWKMFSAAILIAAGMALCASSPDANSSHFVIVNDSDVTGNNYGTVLKLAGTTKRAALSQVSSLATGEPNWEGGG